MTRISHSTSRLVLAGLIAGIGSLGLHASEPLRGFDSGRRPVAQDAPVAHSPVIRDRHMLRVTVTDGFALLSGITVSSGPRSAVTDGTGSAMLRVDGWPHVPVSFQDAEGQTIAGAILLPETPAEGVDALVFIDGSTGTFEAVTAGERGPERAELAAAWADLEAYWLTQGIKEDRPVTSRFELGPSLAVPSGDDVVAPGSNGGAAASSLQLIGQALREDREDAFGGSSLPSTGIRRVESRLRMAGSETMGLVAPVNEFHKRGLELLGEHGLLVDEQVGPKAGVIFAELVAEQHLDDESILAAGAELLRQGVSLDPALEGAVRDAMAEAGITNDALTLNGGSLAGGQVSLPGLPGSAPSVMTIDGFEPDNTPATCGSIATDGTPQDRGIDPAGDLDYICFTANCGDTLHIETGLGLATTLTDTVIDLLDPSGNLIASDDDGAATSLWSMLDVKVDVTGTYTLRVHGTSATSTVTNYRVWVIATPGPCVTLDPSEPNNSFASCSPKAADGSYTDHLLRPRGDEDWFCFDVLTCGSTVTFDLNETGDTDIFARLQLFSPTGAELFSTTSTVAQNVVVSETGSFRIRVSASNTSQADPYDNNADSNTGDYALSVSIGAPALPCDTFEPDSSRSQCNPIAGDGVAVPGHSISPVGDVDWYCVQVGCNDTLSVTVTPTPTGSTGSLRPRIELWDPISTAVVTSLTGTVNGNAITLTRTANHAGTWYVGVMRASTATGAVQTGTYNIAVTTTPVPNANCDGAEADSDPSQCNPPIDFAGTRESKTIFPARDSDWICLGDLACGDTVTVQTWATLPAGTSTDTFIEIYKLPNYLLTTDDVASDDDSGDGLFSLVSYQVTTPAAAGTYVAKIRGLGTTTTGPYDVGVTKTSGDCPEPDAFEPDNTSAECTPLPGASTGGHNIFPATDADFYCVDFACGENLEVTVTPTGGSLRPIVALVGPTGTVIQTITATAAGLPATLTTTDNNPGPHFIRVTSSTSTQGNYVIASTRSAGTCLTDAFEPDDTSATCRFTGLPMAPESRAINPATDSDYYCFSLDCGQGVNVTVTPTNGTLRAIVRLREQDGTTLTTVTATAAGEPVTLSRAVSAPGIYTVEVDSSTSTKGLYDIEMSPFDGFSCIDAYEPDNTRDACQPIATDGTVQDHTLLFHPDEDWVCFTVTDCGTRITAGTLQAIPMYDDADTTVQLYGPSGNLIVSATSGGAASHGRLSQIVNDPGEYAIRVIPASTSATSTSGGQYGLQVTLEDVKAELIVPPVEQTLLPAHTQLDAEALTPSTGDYSMIVGSDPFIDIAATGTFLDTGLTSIVVPIGFDFEYFGNSYSNTAIHDNGVLSFSDPTWIPGIGNECIPNATTPNEFIAAFWEDLDGNFTYYQTIGTAPNRMFIAQWNDGYFPATLQVILFEGTNEISMRYGSMLGAGSDGTSATVGIEDLAGNGIQYSCNTSAVFSGLSVSFVPAGPELVPYGNNPACFPTPSFYEVAADTAPLIDISATGTNLGTPTAFTDDSFRTHVLPIAFPYYGNFETVINVTSNGFANFGTGSTSLSNQCPLTATAPLGQLAVYWDDLNPVTSGQILGQLFGVPGSGSAFYVIQWNEIAHFSVGGRNTFQIVLYESGLFEYRYGAMEPTPRGSGNSATIGIKNRAGTDLLTYGCNTEGMVFDGLRLSFTPAPPPEPFQRFTWLDPATMAVLGTGPTYLHPIEGPCDVLLRVAVRDPIACCDIVTEQLVTVPDRFGPVFSSQPAFGVDSCQFLWPPNHGYADFSLASSGALAADNCGGVTYRFSSLSNSSQQEDSTGNGDGGSVDDIMISPDGQVVSLRAERNGACDQLDRKYELFIEAVDDAGNVTTSAPFSVCVYHDMGHNPPGPYRGAEAGSDSDDTRPGWTEGGYGTGCGDGCSLLCDPTQLQ